MVAGAAHQQQQQASQLAPPSSSSAPTEEEEFLKRNVDCVYFLASPLTCKKGSECEYRHSDIARVNPRDCWYWLNGQCLNPKCGFRHPPLDGLLAAEVPAPVVGPSVSLAPVTPYAASKQGVACIYFQKGFCLKGHLCPFLHGPPNKVAQPPPPNPAIKPPPKMTSAAPEKSVREQKVTQPENFQKRVEFLPPQRKQVPRVQTPALARNGGGGGVAMEKKVPPSEEPPRYRPVGVVPPPVMNELSSGISNHGVYETHHVSDNDSILNGKDGDEYSREPTPGFDVLVDNELENSEYYRNEDRFGRSGSHDFDIGRLTDYDLDREMYNEHRDYDRYAWEDHGEPSDKTFAGVDNLERKRYPDSPDRFDESDLRHRISKQRRGNVGGLRSVVSREHTHDSHADRMPRRDSHHRRCPEPASLSSRLRGRIKIPGRSISPGNNNESRVEREIDMGKQRRSRYSPGRPPHGLSNHHSRLRDRIKSRVSEDFNNEGRDHRGSRGSDNGSEFTGPKRLSELKRAYEGQTDRKRKYLKVESQQSTDNLSFEGPKPLSEILKRKRGAEKQTGSNLNRAAGEPEKEVGSNQPSLNRAAGEPEKEVGSNQSSLNRAAGEKVVDSNQSSLNRAAGELQKEVGSNQSSMNRDAIEPEKEADLIDEDAILDRELEAYDHKDGDYDYEQIDGEGYNLDEGEEYMEEEEYAKKESDDLCS